MGRVREAEADYDAALGIQRQLAAEFPTWLALRNDLAGSCVNLAHLHCQQKNWAAARQLLEEGLPHHLVALRASPSHPIFRQFYRNHLTVLTGVHAALLEKEQAVRTAETRRDLNWNAPADAYDGASSLSNCILIVSQHAQLDETQRQEAAQFYADAAMKMLRDAIARGYQDAAKLKTDAAFAPLRQHDSFQKLLAELGSKGK